METTQNTWFIAHNEIDIFHYGFVETGKRIDTGQPNLELFYNEQDWLDRLTELNINLEEDGE